MSNEIGKIFEQYGEKRCEWHISDFMSLVQNREREGAKYCYKSPGFYFADCCWCVEIHLNTEEKYKDWIGLYLRRMDPGVTKSFKFELSMMRANDTEHLLWKGDGTFSHESIRWGSPRVLTISELLNREADVFQSGILTFVCALEYQSEEPTEGSLFKRLWNLSRSLKSILDERKRTDVVFQVDGREIPAHRMILESRSSVFNSMFKVDMREAQTGEVPIKDGDEDTYNVVLSYVYSGIPEGICAENACEVYKIAHKYELEELKKLCVEFIQEYLTVENVCNVMIFADVYKEMELKECARNFFIENASEALVTQEWKTIRSENSELGFQLLEYVLGKGS